jgi:uracil-DNA glycosylase
MDAPKSLASAAERESRIDALRKPHMAPLVQFVQRLRIQMNDSKLVPDFDPLDGGAMAECLFLLEAPGGKAVGSGFVSRNNPDETAKNFFLLNQEADLARQRTVTWNIVPWYVGSGSKIRAVTQADINASEPHLQRLLELLPRVYTIVLIGRKAQRAKRFFVTSPNRYTIFECPHPSPLSLNSSRGGPSRRDEILTCLKLVAQRLQ